MAAKVSQQFKWFGILYQDQWRMWYPAAEPPLLADCRLAVATIS
jgi:hypothetical protein